MKTKKIEAAIIMGSDSDLEVLKDSAEVLEQLGVQFELTIVSAHRTPKRLYDYVSKAHTRGIQVIIAGAGGAAHLPGMAAALTHLPVIGVPVKSKASLEGLDSLLSIVQMPPGIPVATVAVNGARNAGILAAQILSIGKKPLAEKIKKFKKDLSRQVLNKVTRLEENGYKAFLKNKAGGIS